MRVLTRILPPATWDSQAGLRADQRINGKVRKETGFCRREDLIHSLLYGQLSTAIFFYFFFSFLFTHLEFFIS